MLLHYTALVPSLGLHIGSGCEAGLSTGMQTEHVPPHRRKKEGFILLRHSANGSFSQYGLIKITVVISEAYVGNDCQSTCRTYPTCFAAVVVFCELRLLFCLWLDLTTYDTAKHLILKKTSLKDNPVTHTLARCVIYICVVPGNAAELISCAAG